MCRAAALQPTPIAGRTQHAGDWPVPRLRLPELSRHLADRRFRAHVSFPGPARLPSDGQPFCLYTPGKAEWSPWFQNRNGHTPQASEHRRGDALAVTTAAAKNVLGLPYVRFGRDPRTVPLAEIQKTLAEPAVGLDYDMLLMFAIGTAQENAQGFTVMQERTPTH